MTAEKQKQWDDHVVWQSKLHGQFQEDGATHAELLHARTIGIGKFIPYRYDAAMAVIEGRLDRRFSASQQVAEEGFLGMVACTNGALLEVGGPTSRYDKPLASIADIAQKTGRKVHILSDNMNTMVDVMGDANALPFRSRTLGLVIASCLPQDAREHFFNEAYRSLEPGGLLAYQRAEDLDVSQTLNLGFDIVAYSTEPRTDIGEAFGIELRDRRWTFVAQKPTS